MTCTPGVRNVLVAGVLGGALLIGSEAAAGPGNFPGFSPGGTIELVGHIDPSQGTWTTSDVTGWVDPATQKEYAIIGEWNGDRVFLIDVSDPENPAIASTLNGVPNFDLKVHGNYLYLVDGDGSGNDGRIFDISNPAQPSLEGSFLSAHNIFIDDRGYMYNEYFGLTILDLNADPTTPNQMYFSGADGHDATVVGTTLYDFHGWSNTRIFDVTNPGSPSLLGTISGDGVVYHHSGWPSADGRFLYLNDELSSDPQPDIMVYDLLNPANPVLVDSFQDPNSTIHNTYRIGSYLFASYYTSGFRIFDVSDPYDIAVVDEYDTSPSFLGEGDFNGAWGCHPFTPSGLIYVSDIEHGLFIFRFTPPTATDAPVLAIEPTGFELRQNHPNPVRHATTIDYVLERTGSVDLSVYDLRGRRVRSLVSGDRTAGPAAAIWDGRDELGKTVAAGTYFYRLEVGGQTETRRMVVVR